MPYRKILFATDEIYHILNRGIAQAPIFSSPKEYLRFLSLVDFYRWSNPPLCFSHYNRLTKEEKEKFMDNLKKRSSLLVEIFAYCLMPNHFHLLLRQIKEKGIPKMLANLQNGYARYFNLKHKRQGALFQAMFRAVRIETDEQFLHISRYIHLNPSSSCLVEIDNLSFYLWSSFPEYLGKQPVGFVNGQTILNLIGGKEKYKKFVFNQAEYQRELDKIKHLSLENP
jgi:putative transposase